MHTRTEADVALRQVGLADEEEKVLRMRYGIPLDPRAPLEARGQAHAETRTVLARMEHAALAHLQESGVDVARRTTAIARLRKLGGPSRA
ncbi:MAG: hypothetical protein EXR79_08935 [Myxococcales bacterium]|nr:hypothetical protein [Myxococcales bacterium]